MDAMTERAFELMIGPSGITKGGVDRKRAVIAIKAADAMGLKPEIMAMLKSKRESWLNYLTITQRQWQRRSRNPERVAKNRLESDPANRLRRARESVATREQYVRCSA